MKLLLNDLDNVFVQTGKSNSPPGTKVARTPIATGDSIIKYGVPIGFAKSNISEGQSINTKNFEEDPQSNFSNLPTSKKKIVNIPDKLKTFSGYPSILGQFATRNYLAIHTSVQCVEGILKHATEIMRKEVLPQYPNVDGIVLLSHSYGCGVAIDAKGSEIPKRTLVNLALNPNFGGYGLFVGLGCEKLRHKWLIENLFKRVSLNEFKYDTLYFQSIEECGFKGIVNQLIDKVSSKLKYLNKKKRVPVCISKIILGSQCGGSDSFSGITSNPVVGALSDLLVDEGGTSVFSETTECIPGETYLKSRCKTISTKKKLATEFKWYKNYLKEAGVDHSANTTPGNKQGGLSSIIEKSLGSISKSGYAPISDILGPGERLKKSGLNFLSGPASDFVCGTLLLASGCTLQIFTTGRGTPYSIDGMPVLKVSSNSAIKEKWHDLIDFDCGVILSGSKFDEVTVQLLERIVKIASGEKTCAERLEIKNSLVLFNPAPIT